MEEQVSETHWKKTDLHVKVAQTVGRVGDGHVARSLIDVLLNLLPRRLHVRRKSSHLKQTSLTYIKQGTSFTR